MGAYSQIDAELRYGGAFVDDETDETRDCPAFVPDEDEADTIPNPTGDGGSEEQPEPAQLTQSVQATEPVQAQPQSAAADTAKAAAEEDAKRKAHEEAEAKRKAEWEAKQKKKKADELLQLAKLDAMSNEELMTASTQRVSADTEKITRRNMMECVMEHIQTLCLDDPTFARKVMHPRKNMIRCYQYINRKAWEYVQDEMKAKGIKPNRENPSYASAIPEGVCYQWAVDYFNDPDAKEDHEEKEKFVPQPYRGTSAAPAKKTGVKKKEKSNAKVGNTKAAKPEAQKKQNSGEQLAFGDFVMPEEKAG